MKLNMHEHVPEITEDKEKIDVITKEKICSV